MLKFRSFFLNFFLFLVMIFAVASPVAAQTAEWGGVCVGYSEGEDGPQGVEGAEDVATIQGLECLIANVFTVILTIIGLAGFVMFIWGSFTWMLSGGNPKGVENARNTMMFAVVGLIVALSGFILLNLISAFTGVNVTSFIIPGSDVEVAPSGGGATSDR